MAEKLDPKDIVTLEEAGRSPTTSQGVDAEGEVRKGEMGFDKKTKFRVGFGVWPMASSSRRMQNVGYTDPEKERYCQYTQ